MSMKMAVFWVVMQCSMVEIYQCSRDAYCLNYHSCSLWFLSRLLSAVFPLTPLLSPNPCPLIHWSGHGYTLSNHLPCLTAIPHARLIHQLDDGGSKHL
jgi:hypothetical protein